MDLRRIERVALRVGETAIVAAVGLCAVATSPSAAADGRHPSSHAAPALCASSAVHLVAKTDRPSYGPGQMVVLRSSITNVSKTACSVWLGVDPGFSPSFVVANAKGKEVWDRCDVDDQPGACSTLLMAHRLGPGQAMHFRAHWDQGSATGSNSPHRVRPGTYTFVTHYQNIPGIASRQFRIQPASGR
jgi:hypothetical protein